MFLYNQTEQYAHICLPGPVDLDRLPFPAADISQSRWNRIRRIQGQAEEFWPRERCAGVCCVRAGWWCAAAGVCQTYAG